MLKTGEVVTCNIFLYVLGYSRIQYLEVTFDHSQKTLFQCLNQAFYETGGIPQEIRFDNMEKNPFERVTRPKAKRTRKEKEIKFYTSEEVQPVLSYLENKVKQVNSKNLLYKYFAQWDLTMYRLLAFSGIRGSEMLALTWEYVNFEKGLLTINKTL